MSPLNLFFSNTTQLPFSSFPITYKKYHRNFDEVSAYRAFQLENGNTKVFINALGVSAKDIDVKVNKVRDGYMVLVSGETEIETLGKYSVNYNFFVESEIEEIDPITVKDGILTLEIKWKNPVVDLKIGKISEG